MRHVRFIATYLELSLLLGDGATPLPALARHYLDSLSYLGRTEPSYPYLGD